MRDLPLHLPQQSSFPLRLWDSDKTLPKIDDNAQVLGSRRTRRLITVSNKEVMFSSVSLVHPFVCP